MEEEHGPCPKKRAPPGEAAAPGMPWGPEGAPTATGGIVSMV